MRVARRPPAWPPRLWTLLLASNLTVLALPLAGLWGLRLYESALVRQTEAELIAQAAVLAGAFREELRRTVPDTAVEPPHTGPGPAALGLGRRQGLDLARDPVLPPPPAPAMPVQPPDLAMQAAGQALTPVLRDAQAVTLAALRAVDRHGTIVATTGSDGGLSLASWEEVSRVLGGELFATTLRRREKPATEVPGGISRTVGLRVFVALPITLPNAAGDEVVGAVVLSRTPSNLGQAAWGKRYELVALAALLLTAGALLAVAISRLIARPLAVVVEQAQRAARNEAAVIAPLARPGTREVSELSDAIVVLADTLVQRAGYIRSFAASVSHEFKTPLAAARGAAELLEDHHATLPAAERTRLLHVVTESTVRLDLLVRRLLDLARADMMRPGDGSGRLLVGPVLDRLAARYRARGLDVEIRLAGTPSVVLPEDALDALLASLLDNALAHAGPAPSVRIEAATDQDWTSLTIGDDGPGITPAHHARVFEPFFTTARERGGTGLGLSIARAIAAGAGGTINLVSAARGTVFRLVLPG